MSVEIVGHILIENLKTGKYSYLGTFNSNFLNNHLDIDFDWMDEPPKELIEAFWQFQEEKYTNMGFVLLTSKKLKDYIEDIEKDISQIKSDRENDYHIVHTSKSKAAVEAAMKRIAWTKGAIEYRRKEIAEINYYKIGLDFVSELVAKYDFNESEKKIERTQEMNCLLEYR